MAAQYIDMTPTWEGLVPALLAIYESGERAYALAEIYRMARAADMCIALTKAEIAELKAGVEVRT